jgi:serine/threonine protein kinase
VASEFAGRYLIERELGRGATSLVYLARELATGRDVAIKILRAELVTEISTERFLREIRVTSRLEHPNIVPVLDSGEYDDRLFFVLPHMDGGTLRERLERSLRSARRSPRHCSLLMSTNCCIATSSRRIFSSVMGKYVWRISGLPVR